MTHDRQTPADLAARVAARLAEPPDDPGPREDDDESPFARDDLNAARGIWHALSAAVVLAGLLYGAWRVIEWAFPVPPTPVRAASAHRLSAFDAADEVVICPPFDHVYRRSIRAPLVCARRA